MMAMYFRGKDYDTTDRNPIFDKKMISILWGFASNHKGWLLLAVVVMLFGTAVDLLRPYLLKVAIDNQIPFGDTKGLTTTAQIYGMSIVASALLAYWQTYLLQFIGQNIIFNIRQKVFRHLMYQQYASIEGQQVGRMVTRVTNDTDAIKDLYTDVLVAFASDILILLGIIIVMLLINWKLALVSFTIIPFMFLLAALYQKYARIAYRLVREKTANMNTYIQESLNGIAVVKAFARFRRSEHEYRTASDQYLAAGLKEMRTFAVFRPLVDLIYTLAVVLVLWYSGWFREPGIELGVLVAFLRYVEKFFWPIKDLSEKYSLLQSALAATERVYDLISAANPDEVSYIEEKAHARVDSVTFDRVWFAYEESRWVLQDLSFTIEAGQLTGIVGLSGSGKSTILSLLLRFYEPQRGRILLGDTDIRDIPYEILRSRIGVVFQDVHLFKGTVADNISLFNDELNQQEVEAAAIAANIHEPIMHLPLGYQTEVGYQGAFLSAGQRQLLSLARALAADANILALDEATSSIDSETEGLIQQALERAGAERTVIVVAHRLSTVQKAKKIIVLHRGRLVEEGSHDQLMANQNLYFRLYNSQ